MACPRKTSRTKLAERQVGCSRFGSSKVQWGVPRVHHCEHGLHSRVRVGEEMGDRVKAVVPQRLGSMEVDAAVMAPSEISINPLSGSILSAPQTRRTETRVSPLNLTITSNLREGQTPRSAGPRPRGREEGQLTQLKGGREQFKGRTSDICLYH